MPSNYLFSLTLPEAWEDKTVFTYEGPNENGVQHNLVLVIDPEVEKGETAEEYAQRQLGTSKIVLPGFALISEKEITLASGINAYEIIYKYMPSDERSIFQKQVFFIADNRGYSFTASFSKQTLKTAARDVDRIIGSFRSLKLGSET
jgi:hypothetical protein